MAINEKKPLFVRIEGEKQPNLLPVTASAVGFDFNRDRFVFYHTASDDWTDISPDGVDFVGAVYADNFFSAGVVTASLGFSGSLTQLSDGTSYLIAGNNITIASASNGPITISATATSSGSAFTYEFTQAQLTASILPVTHSVGEQYVVAEIYDSTDRKIIPNFVHAIDANIMEVGFASFTPISGTWKFVATYAVQPPAPPVPVVSEYWFSTGSGETYTTGSAKVLGNLTVVGTLFGGSPVKMSGGAVITGSLEVTQAITGNFYSQTGFTGSLTKLSDGTSAFIAGSGMLITSVSNGAVTYTVDNSKFASLTGSVFSGPVQFNTGLSGSLTKLSDGTSAFVGGNGVLVTSASNGAVTFTVDNSKFASLTGSVFTGAVQFNAGLSGSLTKLADGTSYLIAGNNTTIVSQSNGSVVITAIPSGSNTQVQFNDGGTFGANGGLTYNKTTGDLTISGDVAVNGGDITTTATTFNLLAGASSALNVGNAAATNTFSGATKFPQGMSGSLTKLTDGTSAFIGGNGVIVTSASNGAVTHAVDNSKFASLTGSVFTGAVQFTAGLSGSLTKLADGTSYLIAGNNATIVTQSNGSVIITAIPSGSNTQVQFNDGGTFGANSGLTYNKTTGDLAVSGDVAINGGDLTTTATTFNLLAGAATALNVGNTSAVNTFSGTTKFPQGVSGSLTRLTDGTSYLIAGENVQVVTGSSGAITISAPSYAIRKAVYLLG